MTDTTTKIDHDVMINWLGSKSPEVACGTQWGMPWPQGVFKKDTPFCLTSDNGCETALQTWPLAYWPDGSLKWTGHAAAFHAQDHSKWTVVPGKEVEQQGVIKVNLSDHEIEVINDEIVWKFGRSGTALVPEIKIAGQVVAVNGRLVCRREDRSQFLTDECLKIENYESRIESAEIEQAGSVLAVIKIRGTHYSQSEDRSWIPFTVRFYLFHGTAAVRMVHSFVFDGDQTADFISGMGIRFGVPLRDELHNRHVRLAGGSTGLFAEPVRMIAGRRMPSQDLYTAQIAGQPIPQLNYLPLAENIAKMAAWESHKLVQTSDNAYEILKRTGEHSAWVKVTGGNRSLGMGYIGDSQGGIAIGLKNFWQLAPTAVETSGGVQDSAEITMWLWSPDAPAMDLRHYDIEEHGLEASYEDVQEGMSSATGIARTSELMIQPFSKTPDTESLLRFARTSANPPHLVCSPEYYHSQHAFGIWGLPNRTSPTTRWIEQRLDESIDFYQEQIQQRHWYGFWDYGDVMHSYDSTRHQWRYDMGGCAWANSELAPDVWLWYSFLRTGRADIFLMAEAMTRHTQEVDCYHTGPLKGLGSRHNVRHWGCGAKEARISQAYLKRFYYYLTADERTGDLLDEVVDADYRTVNCDPLRMIEPKSSYPTHARIGPDWMAYCSNWFTAWERTGKVCYLDKIITGMKCIINMPNKMFSGSAHGYDPESGRLYKLYDKPDIPHLAALMGGPEAFFEMTPVIDFPEWTSTWLHYCTYLQASPEDQIAALGGTISHGNGPHYAKLSAYAAKQTDNRLLACRAWTEFLALQSWWPEPQSFTAKPYFGPDMPEPVSEGDRVSTNDTAQWCLNAIILLELIGESASEFDPLPHCRK